MYGFFLWAWMASCKGLYTFHFFPIQFKTPKDGSNYPHIIDDKFGLRGDRLGQGHTASKGGANTQVLILLMQRQFNHIVPVVRKP